MGGAVIAAERAGHAGGRGCPPATRVPGGQEVAQSRAAPTEGDAVPEVPQPVTDNSVKVRQLTHYQFSWIAGEPGKPGTYTLQLVLDQGAWEEVLTLDQIGRAHV